MRRDVADSSISDGSMLRASHNICDGTGLAEKSEKLKIIDWSVRHEYIYFQVK
jgi:hypothetical protein